MAFSVTPTSGVGPYTLTATFLNKNSIGGLTYGLEVRSTVLQGECFVGVSEGNNSANLVNSIIETGTGTISTNVANTYCRVTSLIIRNKVTGDVVDYENIIIDNT